MKLQDFTGGLNTRLQPQYLGLNEGTIYNNIDNAVGSLSSVRSRLPTPFITDKFVYYYITTSSWISSSTYRSYVEFEKVLYYTDGVQPKRHDGTSTYNLGVVKPTAAPITTTRNIPNEVLEARFDITTTGNLPADFTFYKLLNNDGTYYSSPYDVTLDLRKATTTKVILASLGNTRATIALNRTVKAGVAADRTVNFSNIAGITFAASNVDIFRQYEGVWRWVDTLTGPTDVGFDSVLDISGNDALDEADIAPLAGEFQYVYTFYNSADGIESAPSPASTLLSVLGPVAVNNMQVSADPQVDKKRIYRIGGNVTTFTFVAEVTNATTLFIDDIEDTDLTGDLLDSQNNEAAPATLKYLTEAYAMLFGAVDNKLYFTPIGQPYAWPTLNFLTFDVDITGIAAASNGLIVFTNYKAHIILGTSPTTLSQQPLSGDQGCITAASIQKLGTDIIWMSTDGICVSNGGPVTVASKSKLGKIDFTPISSAVHDQVYYAVNASKEVLAFDFRFNPMFKNLELDVETFGVANDILYGWDSTFLFELFNGPITEILSYTSPRLIEGRITEEKTYKKIYIYADGTFTVEILIDDVIVATESLTGSKSHEIQVPQDAQVGHYIQFNITGRGEISEIEYEAGRSHGHG